MKHKLNGILTLLLVLITQIAFAQDRTVSGVVTDKDGLPVPVANVKVKGTSNGTQTDIDGKYKIKATAEQTLVFSYLGMKTQEVKATGTVVNVKMQSDAKELTDVVVTALGIKKSEKSLGYASQSIKGGSLTEARESNLVNALSGKIAGVQVTNSSGGVGASSRIVLRGASSITGNNQALFVVDGIPFDNSAGSDGLKGKAAGSAAGSGGGRDLPNGVASLNPDDIESITVLKGPTAAALYGMRAAQGVVVITTKRGKEGSKNLGIAFNSNMSFTNPLTLPKFQNSYGQSGRPGDNFFQFTDGSGAITQDGTDESWGMPLDIGLNFVQWDSFKYGGAASPWISHPNNVKDFYNTGISISNSVSLSGGGENANFRFSVGQTDETGMIPFTNFGKFNVSGSGSLKLGKDVTAGLSVNYFHDKSSNLPTVGYTGENAVQQFIWSARNVNFSDLRDWRNLPLATGGAALGTPINWNTQFQNNPYWVLENNTNTYNRDRVNGKFSLGWKFAKGFNISTNVAADHYDQEETTRQAFGSAQNQFGNGTAANGSYSNLTKTFNEFNSDVLLGYTTKLTDDIGFNLNAGMSSMNRIKKYIYGRASALELPGVYNLSNLKSGVTAISENNYDQRSINSVYGFGQLSYKTWFFLDFTGRNDWTSLLTKGNNSFFYPSVSTSVVLSDIFSTLKDNKIDLLKVRAGWAKVGSTGALEPYNLNDTFNLVPGAYGNLANVPGTEFNKFLKPESVTGIEFGIDVNAFNNRLRFAATYYDQKSRDLLLPVRVSSGSGFIFSWQNAGNMDNKGIELQLGTTVLKKDNFSFDIDLNFAKNNNQVVSLGLADSYELGSQWGISLQAIPGQPYGSLVGRDFKRDGAGNVIYLNGLPQIDSTQKILGNIAPDWTGGANFTFKYKNLDFNTLIDAKMGGSIHSMTYAWGRYAGTLAESLIGRENGIVGEGVMLSGTQYVPNNIVVSAKSFNQTAYGNDVESSAIFDASYVKLRQVSFGYSFSKKALNGTFIDGLKLSLVARNLAILYKAAPHIDPESAFSSTNGEQGQEFGQLPSARSIGFNLNVKF